MDGVVPALYLAVQALTKPDAGVIYMPPVYHPIYTAIHDSGRTPVAVPLVVDNGEYAMDFEALGAAMARHVVYSQIDPSFADHAIVCTAPSKKFNIAGLQTSNLVIANRELRHRIVNSYRYSGRHGVNQLGLAACRIAYDQCGDWLDAVTRLDLRQQSDAARIHG